MAMAMAQEPSLPMPATIPSVVPAAAPAAPPAATPAATVTPLSPILAANDSSAISLADAIARALTTNRSLRTTRSALLQARLGRTIAATTVFAPVLSTTYIATNREGDTGAGRVALTSKALGFEIEPYMRFGYGQGQRVDGSDQYGTAAGLLVSRKLFNIAANVAQRLPITQADIAIYTAANNLVLAGRQLEQRVTDSFFAVQRAATRVEVRQLRRTDAREFLATVQDRIAHGFASPLDGLYAELDLNQAEADLLAERTQLEQAREAFNDLLDRPISSPLVIIPEVIDAARVAAIPVRDVEADVQATLSSHETLGDAAKQAELLAINLRIQRDQLLPQVTAGLSVERAAEGARTFNGNDGIDNSVALSLTYTMPLDGWRAERARYQQLTLQIADQERQVTSLRDDLEQSLRNTGRRIEQNRRLLGLAEQRLDIERTRLDATLRRYETGAVDNLEVTRAKQSLNDAEISLLDARIAVVTTDAGYRAITPMTPTPVRADAPEAEPAPAPRPAEAGVPRAP
jgi:outer membrane protein TolC